MLTEWILILGRDENVGGWVVHLFQRRLHGAL